MWIASSRRGDINPETAGRSSSAIPALLLLWPAAAALRLALKYQGGDLISRYLGLALGYFPLVGLTAFLSWPVKDC